MVESITQPKEGVPLLHTHPQMEASLNVCAKIRNFNRATRYWVQSNLGTGLEKVRARQLNRNWFGADNAMPSCLASPNIAHAPILINAPLI